jgi:hypothetical protein
MRADDDTLLASAIAARDRAEPHIRATPLLGKGSLNKVFATLGGTKATSVFQSFLFHLR